MIATSNDIIKPIKDKSEYYFTILSNGLKVFIISDKETDISAASMFVKVGYYDDEIPGLSHFLEHMLFLGNKKYPNEGYYNKIVSQYGGISNAYTTGEYTCYYFDSIPRGFPKILDVFSQFFISPLLTKNAIFREMNAVHSEHIKNINNDDWRVSQIIKNISKKNHVYNRFATGNLETLNIPNMEERITDFFEKTYSSQKMCLVVLDNRPIEELKKITKTYFKQVPVRGELKHIDHGTIFDTPKCVHMKSIKSINTMVIIWEIPNIIKYWSKKYCPLKIIVSLLEHEGNGSIYVYLRKKGWIQHLSCKMGDKINTNQLLVIEIVVTDLGKSHDNEIIETIINYLNIIKTSNIQHYYEELKKIDEQNINDYEKSKPIEKVINIGILIENYNCKPQNVLMHDKIQKEYSNKIINTVQEIINYMTIDKMIVIVSSPDITETTFEDKWYGTNYNIVKCNNYNYSVNKNLYFPKPNKYIINVPLFVKNSHSNQENPKLICNKYGFTFWYQYYDKYDIPYSRFFCNIHLDGLYENINDFLSLNLYIYTLNEHINADIFECNMGNYYVNIFLEEYINIIIYGHEEKMMDVLKLVIDNLMNLKVDLNLYSIVYKDVTNILRNSKYSAPHNQLSRKLNQKICKHYYSEQQLLETKINLKNIKDIFQNNKFCVESLVIGVISFAKVNELCDYLNNKINRRFQYIRQEHITNPTTMTVYSFKNYNQSETNHAVGIYIYIDYLTPNHKNWIKKFCILKIIDALINKDFFKELRTKEQVGYIVISRMLELGCYGNKPTSYHFRIQSPSVSASELTEKIFKFTNKWLKKLKRISEKDFNNLVISQIEKISAPDLDLTSYAQQKLLAITNFNCEFNYKNMCIDEMKKITIEDAIQFYEDYFIDPKGWTIQMSP